MVLRHVMQGRPRGLLQSSGGRVDRILLASPLSSICEMCQKRSGDVIVVITGVQSRVIIALNIIASRPSCPVRAPGL